MKNIIITTILTVLIIGCSEDDQQELSVFGTWQLDTIKYEPNNWLRDFDLQTWKFLEVNIENSNDSSILITSNNSPSKDIFPPSSQWILQEIFVPYQKFSGKVEGLAVEDIDFRYYYLTHIDNSLNISTLVKPDCPDDTDCTLEICCDVQFTFVKKVEINR